jgi:hypothetical protein
VGGFDERLAVFEDSDLWLRLAARGPVCLLPRRTIKHTVNRRGLKERGTRSGVYLSAVELSVRRAEKEVRVLERPGTPDLVRCAQAKVRLVEGVRALTLDDTETAGQAFEDACRLVPDLSADPGVVLGLLRTVASGPGESLALAGAGAGLWPDQRSDTARYLCGYAAVLALRCGRPRTAARLLARTTAPPFPGFVARTMPLTARLLRHWLHGLTARGQESVAIEDHADVPEQGGLAMDGSGPQGRRQA